MNLKHLYDETATDEKTLLLCQRLGLLPNVKICTECGTHMALKKSNKYTFPYRWRCKRPCLKEISVRDNTFFSYSKLPISEILLFIYFWSFEECSVKKIKRELGWHTQAMVDWKSYLREVCIVKLLSENTIIGGVGHVVQIDESLFVRRKFNVGRVPTQQWVFGGIDTLTKECFMVCVERRNAETLLPIIQNRIAPGTTIVSDLWSAYNTLDRVGYRHLTVNHSLNFVDPITFANTQRVENMWMRAKRRNKRECGTSRLLLESYLQEFIWREKYGENPFVNIIENINEEYN